MRSTSRFPSLPRRKCVVEGQTANRVSRKGRRIAGGFGASPGNADARVAVTGRQMC